MLQAEGASSHLASPAREMGELRARLGELEGQGDSQADSDDPILGSPGEDEEEAYQGPVARLTLDTISELSVTEEEAEEYVDGDLSCWQKHAH